MTVLGRLPRWLRRLLLGVNLAAATAVLINWYLAIWPNLAASWELASAAAALAMPAGGWLTRKLDAHAEHIALKTAQHTAAHLTEHHETTRAHITDTLAEHATVQNQRLDVISDQLAALHARLDQQGGTP